MRTMLAILVLFSYSELNATEFVIQERMKGIILGEHIEVYHDTTSAYNQNTLLQRQDSLDFKSYKTKQISLGTGTGYYWLRLKIKNPFHNQREVLLEARDFFSPYYKMFHVGANGEISSQERGLGIPRSRDDYQHRLPLFSINLC